MKTLTYSVIQITYFYASEKNAQRKIQQKIHISSN